MLEHLSVDVMNWLDRYSQVVPFILIIISAKVPAYNAAAWLGMSVVRALLALVPNTQITGYHLPKGAVCQLILVQVARWMGDAFRYRR